MLTALGAGIGLATAGLVTAVTPTTAYAAPTLTVSEVEQALTIPWDITWVGSTMLFNERPGRIWSKVGNGTRQRVTLALPRIYATGEAGLMGMVADPGAASNKYFYTCMAVAHSDGSRKDVEVWKWKLDSPTRATKVKALITGIPLNTSGQHSGCRMRFRSADSLYIGTGDAAMGSAPQSLSSLGGKVLRIRSDGYIYKSNPFYSRGGNARYVYSYGHRNIQGVMFWPKKSEIWTAEHGPRVDDEVNRIFLGDNYGWDPRPGTYNQSVPMTDRKRYPDAHGPKWRSGNPTVATSGGVFLSGSQWENWNGWLAVAMLKGSGIKLFSVASDTRISAQQDLFKNTYGRIRTVQQGPDGALYFLTSNGSGDDKIYRVTPS